MAGRRKIPARLRSIVIERAKGFCEYCRAPETFSLDSFTVDHIQPVTLSGSDDLDNLAFACHNCNNRKQNDTSVVDSITGLPAPLFHPRQIDGIHISSGAKTLQQLFPLLQQGGWTINRLQLNRLGVVNIRRALLALRLERPPDGDARYAEPVI